MHSLISPKKPQVKVFMAWQLTKTTSTSTGQSLTLSSVVVIVIFCFLNGVNNHAFYYNLKTLDTSVPGTLLTDPQIWAVKHRCN